MPEFRLDTSGAVAVAHKWQTELVRKGFKGQMRWADLDAFTQGYIEAAFLTEQGDGTPGEEDASGLWIEVEPGLWSNELGFADLAPETLARMIEDCRAFQRDHIPADLARKLQNGTAQKPRGGSGMLDEAQAGRDFWLTRNSHGAGFWDGDWPEPYAAQLTAAAKAFGEVSLTMGDDGKVHD